MRWKTTLALLASCGMASTVAAQDFDRTNYSPYEADRQQLRQMNSEHGRYVATMDGHALYVLTRDDGRSRCYSTCAEVWPPLIAGADGTLVTRGLDPDLIGTIERADGRMQLTYGGWPLYHYVRDALPGQTEGHDVEDQWGEWRLLTPTGQPNDASDFYQQSGYDSDDD